MSTTKKAVSVVLPPDLEKEIYKLRGKEEYNRLSLGEIMRRLIVAGLKDYETEEAPRRENARKGTRIVCRGFTMEHAPIDEPGLMAVLGITEKVLWINDNFDPEAEEIYITWQ